MLRGIKTFVCDNCGHKFKGMDIEWNATIWSQPLKCPNCGSYQIIYREIWKQMDEAHKAPNAHLSISNF